jgi:hypothetical protein
VTERRRRQQQSAGVSGAVRDGLAVTSGGLRTSQQGFHRFRLSAFGFSVSGFQLLGFLSLSLSLSDSLSLPSAIQKNLGFFLFCSGTLHAHRTR